MAQSLSNRLSSIQLITWNDFGEGTQLEPTVQDGFTDLLAIQKFTGVPYGLYELQLVYELYLAREERLGNAAMEAQLDQAASDINQLNFAGARDIIDQVTIVPEPTALPLLLAAVALMRRRATNRC
jgi:hypothetical protein